MQQKTSSDVGFGPYLSYYPELEDWQKDFEYCIYAKRLLDKVIYLNSIVKVPQVDVLEVKKAIYCHCQIKRDH